nr:RNA-directed DNA polymerase, eukaryota [Tanacetum cinerariifolium]
MSLYKAPKCVLHELERLRNNFLKGGDSQDSKITWVAWAKVLSSKKNGGLGVSSFFALNRALLLKWVWRYLVQDGSLWYFCDINGDGAYRVKDIRSELDDLFLPSSDVATRWVNLVPIKVNIFAWHVSLDPPDSRICRLWNIQWEEVSSFVDWFTWFGSIRLPSKLKAVLDGVFYSAWWHVWSFRNRLIFDSSPPRRSVIFDDLVSASFNWCINRSSSSCTWENWLKKTHI